MAEKNRLRDKQIKVFLLDDEYELLRAKCDELGLNYSEYFRQLIRFGSVKQSSKKDSKEEIKKFRFEINGIGRNINQIAHRVNANRFESKQDYENLMYEISHLYHAYSKVVKGEVDSFNCELEDINQTLKNISEKKNISDKDILYMRKIIKELRTRFNEFMKVEI